MKKFKFHFYVNQFEKFQESTYQAPDLDSAISMLKEEFAGIKEVSLVEDGKYIRINF